MRGQAPSRGRVVATIAAALLILAGCRPDEAQKESAGGAPASTPLPTRQTTIDPVKKKLEEAERENERRRAEIDKASQ